MKLNLNEYIYFSFFISSRYQAKIQYMCKVTSILPSEKFVIIFETCEKRDEFFHSIKKKM